MGPEKHKQQQQRGERNLQRSHFRSKKQHLKSGFDNNGDIKKL